MKRKILSLVLAFTLVFCASFGAAGCGFGNTGDNGGGDIIEKPEEPEKPIEPEEPEEPELPAEGELENADLLANAYDRLENADLSFRFEMDFSHGANAASEGGKKANRKMQRGNTSSRASVLQATPDDIPVSEFGNFFEQSEGMMQGMSLNARQLADYAIDHITVMNTLVRNPYMDLEEYWLLDYDVEKDVLSVINYEKKQKDGEEELKNYKQIKLSYDEEGTERVDMQTWERQEDYANPGTFFTVVNQIEYIAGKHYTFLHNQYGEDWGVYDYISAYKEDGFWRGASFGFDINSAYFQKQGSYKNGMRAEFLVETEEGVSTFREEVVPYRNGEALRSWVPEEYERAEAGDELRLRQGISSPCAGVDVTLDYDCNLMIRINLSELGGWEKLTIYPQGENYEHWMNSPDDRFVLSNGTVLSYGDLWTEELGWLTDPFRNGSYSHLDGSELTEDETAKINWENAVRIDPVRLGRSYDGRLGGSISFQTSIEHFDVDKEAWVNRIAACCKANGLYVKGEDNFFENVLSMPARGEKYASEIYAHLFGRAFTVNNLISVDLALREELDGFEEGIEDELKKFEQIDFDDMPPFPEEVALVPMDSLTGKATVTEGKIDFSQMSFTVQGNLIMSKGKEYTVLFGWNGVKNFLPCFEGARYEGNSLSLTGGGETELRAPHAYWSGELTLFFGRETEEGAVRLSERVVVPVEEFAPFEAEEEVEGGKYIYRYSYADGAVKLETEFEDKFNPIITVEGLESVYEEQEDGGYLHKGDFLRVPEGATIAYFFDIVTIHDNFDGGIALDLSFITGLDLLLADDGTSDKEEDKEEKPTYKMGDPLKKGNWYSITVSDRAGNVTETNFRVLFPGEESSDYIEEPDEPETPETRETPEKPDGGENSNGGTGEEAGEEVRLQKA